MYMKTAVFYRDLPRLSPGTPEVKFYEWAKFKNSIVSSDQKESRHSLEITEVIEHNRIDFLMTFTHVLYGLMN